LTWGDATRHQAPKANQKITTLNIIMAKLSVKQKNQKFEQNVHKRGLVNADGSKKKESTLPVGPVVLGLFVFVVVGSALLQIFKTQPGP